MSLRTAIRSALKHFEVISTREIRVALFVCITIAALNALAVAFRVGYLYGNEACKCSVPMHRDYSYDFIRMKVELALLVVTLALRSRRIIGLGISVLATIYVEAQYGFWYLDTKRWLRDVRLTDLSQIKESDQLPHFAGIYQARPWDIVLLVFATALLAWQVRVVIALITSDRRKQSA